MDQSTQQKNQQNDIDKQQSHQCTFGFDWSSWNDDFDARSVSEVSLGTLAVVKGAVTDGATRGANGEAPIVKQISASIAIFRCFIDDLIERREDVVGELNFWRRRRKLGVPR